MIRREALKEYAEGSLWLFPTIALVVALIVGSIVSQINVPPDSALAPITFQGTADDARNLLVAVTSTVVTVIALVLGLTVVALQLSSTQFSPRLLRNFLRHRTNQVVLSIFLATFAYSAAGLFTVGISAGERTDDYPRLAVSGAIVMLFASLAAVVVFADHLSHSIQIDAITRRVESGTLAVLKKERLRTNVPAPDPPDWAVPVLASRSGYVQTAHPDHMLPLASGHRVTIRLIPMIGEHVVAGTLFGWVWRPSAADAAPDPHTFAQLLDDEVHIGFERTLQQDSAFGIRQLVDVASKALSPAVNDPYTAVQAIDHLSVIFASLARQPLGSWVARDADGAVIVPGRLFGDYLSTMCGLLRRFGSREPTVSVALLRLLRVCAHSVGDDTVRRADVRREALLVIEDAEHNVANDNDLVQVRTAFASVDAATTPAADGAIAADAHVRTPERADSSGPAASVESPGSATEVAPRASLGSDVHR